MNESIQLTRRSFIRTITALGLAASTPRLAVSALGAAKPKWPVGCRDIHLKVAGKPDSWACMRALGAEGIEVQVAPDMSCANLFHPAHKYTLATEAGIATLQADLEAGGGSITAFMMSNHLDERLEEEIEWTRRLVIAAAKLKVHTIRVDVVPRKLDGEKFLAFAIEACKRICEAAKDTPIRFGVENHSKITNDPEFLEKLFDGVGSSKLGLTLDCANFYWWGHPVNDLYKFYEKFAPRAVHTHCKSIRYPEDKKHTRREMGWEYGKYNCPIYEGDIDFKRVVNILRSAGYQGDLCVEDESLGKAPEADRAEIMRKEIAFLKGLV